MGKKRKRILRVTVSVKLKFEKGYVNYCKELIIEEGT